jgi:hypothetical protein
MASIFIQETLGKDTSEQLYSIEKDFDIVKSFIDELIKVESKEAKVNNWNKLFNLTDSSEFMQVFKNRTHLGKQIL